MKLFKYNQFLDLNPINENVAKAKSYLKEFYLTEKAARELGFITEDMDWEKKEGERRVFLMKDFTSEQQQQIKNKIKGRGEFEGKGLRVSDGEIRIIEALEKPDGTPTEFKMIRETKAEIKNEQNKVEKSYQLDKDHPGWISHFTYFYFAENQSFNQLDSLYERLIQYKDLLDKLPKKFDAAFIDEKIPNKEHAHSNAEDLSDELDKLLKWKHFSKIKQTLPPNLKRELDNASEFQIKDFFEIASGFAEFEPVEKREIVWKNFFGEMLEDRQPNLPNGQVNPNFGKVRYMSRLGLIKNLTDFIKSAKAHLSGSSSSGYTDRIEKINITNDKFGIKGARIVYNESGIMIVRVYSYAANNFLNSHCSHCIVNRGDNYWDSYVGDTNAQYYIYNFNIPNTNSDWTIGVSIKPDRTYTSGACQNVRNEYIGGKFKQMLNSWQKEYGLDIDIFNDVLNPLTREELDKQARMKLADREIVKKGITINQIKQLVTEDGANINKDNGKALLNAVEEDDVEKVKFIIDLGASLTIGNPASKAKSFAVIKTLADNGVPISEEAFDTCFHDLEALDYLLKSGLNPNYGQQKPFRKCIKGTWSSTTSPGESYFEQFKIVLKAGGVLRDERGRNTVVKWCSEYARFDIFNYLDEIGLSKDFPVNDYKEALTWVQHGIKIPEEDRQKVREYLQNKIDERT